MANERNSGFRAMNHTPVPNQIAYGQWKFDGSSSSSGLNNPSSVNFNRSSSLRLSQMNNSFNFSSIPCIFSSPRVSSPKLSRYLARNHSWDFSHTDFSLENERVPFSENLPDAGVNLKEQSDSESSGIDISDILLDSPNEEISMNPKPVPRELTNLHSDSRRSLLFETTGFPPRNLGDIYPNFITTYASEKPESGSLHLNSMVANVVKEEGEDGPSQINPKKKRRRLGKSEENVGCKRCNCKKSKCLKLYCECFAAGLYCIDSCSCQECFNKPIHVDIVVATRNLIQNRNPLAFAPKVVNVPEVASKDSINNTPVSARHKTGCNCKKSSCLKKYCECLQGGVGCSSNCRCDACKNPLGRKDGSKDEETKMIEIETINVENNQDSKLCPIPLMTIRGIKRERTELPYLAIRRPLEMPNFSVFPESSYNAGQRVGKENMLPPWSMFEKRLETVRKEDHIQEIMRVGLSPRSGINITSSSSSPNSKRVSSSYNYNDGSFPTSSKRRRKIVLQSIPSFPPLTPKEE